MTVVRALAAHAIPDRPPLRVVPGDEVVVGDRDTTWPAFVFVTAAHGQGWVPARHLRIEPSRTVVVTGYDTTELPTASGELLEIGRSDPESGWVWCRNRAGSEGWVPAATIEYFDHPEGASPGAG